MKRKQNKTKTRSARGKGLQDATWALFKAGSSGPVPVDDKCELCYRVWKECFSSKEWEQLVAEAKNERMQIGALVTEARKNMAGNDFKVGSSVSSNMKVQYEVSKLFMLASEKDLRSLTHQPRINRADVKSLPVLQVPSDKGDGSMEPHYVLKHPHGDLKECKVKLVMETSMDQEMMGAGGKEWFVGQAQQTFGNTVGTQSSQSGLLNLFQKEAYLQDFQEWKRRFKKPDDDDGEAQFMARGSTWESGLGEKEVVQVEDDDNDDDGDENLTGLAASDLKRAASSRSLETWQPTPAKNRSGKSSPSVCSGGKTAVGDGASVAGSAAASSAKAAGVRDPNRFHTLGGSRVYSTNSGFMKG